MDDDLIARLNAASAGLQARAGELQRSGPDRDTALLMDGLAVALEAIGQLASTAERLDGLKGLGAAGASTLPSN